MYNNRLLLISALLLLTLGVGDADVTGCSSDVTCEDGILTLGVGVAAVHVKNCSLAGVTCQNGNVQKLNLTAQGLTKLPDLSKLTGMLELHLDNNSLTDASLTGKLSGLKSLQTFSIDYNNLVTWNFTNDLSSQLISFSANTAGLTGQIPGIFNSTSFPGLTSLHLAYNNITNPLPASLGSLSGMQSLWVNNQSPGMSGTIDVIGSMSSATELWLQSNKFTGPIPEFKNLNFTALDFRVRDNQLTGIVPNSLRSSQNVTLQNNKFQGPMPNFGTPCDPTETLCDSYCTTPGKACDPQVTVLLEIASLFGYPLVLASSWTGNDPCSSKKWDGITCTSGTVTAIDFSNHGFSGNIDSTIFANLTSLRRLNLSRNSITGPIPQSLADLSNLTSLDVSYNQLSGQLPKFKQTVSLNDTGNPELGKKEAGPSPAGPSPGSSPGTKKKGMSSWAITVVVLFIITTTALVGYYVCRRCSMKKKAAAYKRHSQHSDSEACILSPGSQQLSQHNFREGGFIEYNDLIQATNNFSQANIIGQGGFGTVYKGTLPGDDKTQVAVKRMVAPEFMSTKGMHEYNTEIKVLSKVKHRNLVFMFGFCCNGNERLVVYELMPQGTLGDHLFDWRKRGGRPLTWSQRAAIALDVARGVAYLHTMAESTFIHRDLKPNNILLGNDMRAKVADFGLVKDAGTSTESVHTKVAGTFGYFAPEYFGYGKVTAKADVYAFGVILMEIITGRQVTEAAKDGDGNLMKLFKMILAEREDLREHIDPVILEENDDEETYTSIKKAVELAGHCLEFDPQRRCNMNYAVSVLTSLVEQWTPSNSEATETFGAGPNMPLNALVEEWKAGDGDSYSYA